MLYIILLAILMPAAAHAVDFDGISVEALDRTLTPPPPRIWIHDIPAEEGKTMRREVTWEAQLYSASAFFSLVRFVESVEDGEEGCIFFAPKFLFSRTETETTTFTPDLSEERRSRFPDDPTFWWDVETSEDVLKRFGVGIEVGGKGVIDCPFFPDATKFLKLTGSMAVGIDLIDGDSGIYLSPLSGFRLAPRTYTQVNLTLKTHNIRFWKGRFYIGLRLSFD